LLSISALLNLGSAGALAVGHDERHAIPARLVCGGALIEAA